MAEVLRSGGPSAAIRGFLEQVSDDEMASLQDAVVSATSHRAAC
jgi:hypothetical protein